MKNIIFLIILLCIAAASYGQSYRYDKVMIIQKGDGSFGFDNKQIQNKSGTIIVKKDRVSIDFKRYRIKRQISDNLYKTRGGTVEYVYNDAVLHSIRIHRFNMDYHYRIKNDKAMVVAR